MTIRTLDKPRGMSTQKETSMKTSDYKAGEQNVYAYQAAHPLATLRYAIRNLLRRSRS